MAPKGRPSLLFFKDFILKVISTRTHNPEIKSRVLHGLSQQVPQGLAHSDLHRSPHRSERCPTPRSVAHAKVLLAPLLHL